jgi:hypothetical protein
MKPPAFSDFSNAKFLHGENPYWALAEASGAEVNSESAPLRAFFQTLDDSAVCDFTDLAQFLKAGFIAFKAFRTFKASRDAFNFVFPLSG